MIDFVIQSFNDLHHLLQLSLTLDSTSGLLTPSWAEWGRGLEHAIDDKVDLGSIYWMKPWAQLWRAVREGREDAF